MKKPLFQKLVLFFVCSLSLSGCVSTSSPNPMPVAAIQHSHDSAQRAPAHHAWGPYHWARSTPQFTLKVGDNLNTAAWKAHLGKAATDWNSPQSFGASSTPVMIAVTAGSSSKRQCAMVPGTTQVCNQKYGNNGWLGLASINIINGQHITQGAAKMNDSYFNTARYNNPNEKQHVMCQEIAHTFGLAHQSEDGSSQNSCMDYFSNTGTFATSTTSTTPNAHDFEMLASIYLHMDNTTTVSPMAEVSAASDVSEDPQSWGRFMREHSRGRHGYYERANRDGSITLTHVYWIKEVGNKCHDCDHRDHDH